MRRAIELARDSARTGGGPFGAVVVRDGEVVAEGTNRVVAGVDPTAHAEVEAVRAACRRLDTHVLADCEVYSSCEPCPMCLAALYWARVRRVVFACTRGDAAAIGFDDEFLYRELALPEAERALPIARALRDEGRAVFAEWEAKADKEMY